MSRYEIIIYWSNEDQAFLAEAPELPGCMAHGNSYEEALGNLQDAIEMCIRDRCRPAPRTGRNRTGPHSLPLPRSACC